MPRRRPDHDMLDQGVVVFGKIDLAGIACRDHRRLVPETARRVLSRDRQQNTYKLLGKTCPRPAGRMAQQVRRLPTDRC